MRRALFVLIIVGIAAAGLPAMAETYYIVLKDGTWAPVAGTPTVQGKIAYIPLRNGLVASIAAEHIDWQKSGVGEQPDGEHAVPGKGLAAEATIGNMPAGGFGDGSGQTATKPSPPPSLSAAPAAAGADPAADKNARRASIQAKINTLGQGINSLQGQKAEVLDRMSRQWNMDEKAKLRKQADEISKKILDLRDEKERLLTELWGTL